jgi:hypothetical protein
MQNAKRTFFLLTTGLVLLLQQQALAKEGWAITSYVGKFNNDAFLDILSSKPVMEHPNFEDSYITVLAVSKEWLTVGHYFALEAEGQIGKHYGMQHHFEFNAVLVGRWRLFPWNNYLQTSLAVGEGLSYATEVPALETDFAQTKSRHFLNYLMGELALQRHLFQGFNMRRSGPVSALFFPPFAMGKIGGVIAPLGPFHQS